MANTYDTNVKLQAIATAITNAATSDPNLLAKLQAIADAITNGGGGGSVTASNVSVVPTSPFVSTNLQNLSVEEANAIASNAGDITTINTALGNTSISGIGDGSVTGAISTNNSNINTINTALGNTSISGIGDGSVTGAISTLNSSLTAQSGSSGWYIAGHRFWSFTGTTSSTVGGTVSISYPDGKTGSQLAIIGYECAGVINGYGDRIQLIKGANVIAVYTNHSSLVSQTIVIYCIE